MLSMQDSLVILAIVLVLFGGKKLPEIATGMGKAIKGFKKELNSPDEIEITPEKDEAVQERYRKTKRQIERTAAMDQNKLKTRVKNKTDSEKLTINSLMYFVGDTVIFTVNDLVRQKSTLVMAWLEGEMLRTKNLYEPESTINDRPRF